ncbi:MAG TPA: immunoglobulin domain-containing protein [Verrucomicrobiae bacterium]|jgi:hypothetical protein|nr:immunoglobulin domain-containing protein [Verrucomicrobiae bacterium]
MKMNPMKSVKSRWRATWSAGVAVAALCLVTNKASAQLAQPFTQGNIVVDRVGDGSAALSGAGAAVFFDQYTPSGTFVSTVAIPTNGANALVDTGNSTTEGFVSLSPSGTNLVFGGYNVPLGTAGLPGGAVANPRIVATVDYNGTYTPITTAVAFNSGNLRSVATDGNGNYWGSGSVVGTFYFGTTTSTNYISTTVANERVIQVVGGDIYFSTGSGTRGIYKITGTPTGTGNTAVNLFGSSSSAPLAFSFSPAMDQAYMVDSTTFSTSSGPGGIEKWTNNSGTWSFLYSLAPAADGVAVDWTTTPPTIYATLANGSALVKVQDTGVGAAIVTNAVASANTAFRSVTFAPTNTVSGPLAPSISAINPSSLSASSGGTATFKLTGFTGSPVASNNWYEVTGTTTNLISHAPGGVLTLSNLTGGSYSIFAILTNSSGSATSSVASLTVTPNPVITAITPSTIATNPAATVKFTLTANPGSPTADNFWFKIAGGTTNALSDGATGSGSTISGSTTTALTIANISSADVGGYFAILTNSSGAATSSVATLTVTNFPPAITSVTPAGITNRAGQNATFTVANSGTPPFTYFWYKETATDTNLIFIGTTNVFTLAGITGGDTAGYQVVASNVTSINATSAVVSLLVTNDPSLLSGPASTHGLLYGTAQFSAVVAGSGLSYQWYFADANGNPLAPISDGAQTSGSTISGSTSSILTFSNLQLTDPTNVFLVATGTFGSVTSSVVSLLDVSDHATLAFWDFNGVEFTNTAVNPNSLNNPAPFLGNGTASAVGTPFIPPTSPFSGSVDANDGTGFTQHLPPFSWGTSTYPLTGGNKQNGVQFNVSTLGARNIKVSYESRVSATASDYERLQYTTNQTDWTDFPASSSFNGIASSYLPYSYDLTGFPGVANNPDFGVRVVTEFQSTALYGLGTNNGYVGTANTYGTSGTVTYDLVTVTGDTITNATSVPPILGEFVNTNLADFETTTVDFTVTPGTTPANLLTFNAVSLNPTKVNPTFTFGGSGTSRTLHIVPNNPIPDQIDAAPIMVTVTDTNGDSSTSWFILTVTSINLAPTNSLVHGPGSTNTLANQPVVIPFTVSDDRSSAGQLSYTVTSDNNTLVPSGNIVVGNQGTFNPTLTITPANNQLGVALLTIAVNDNDTVEPRSTPANIALMVRPNTNVVAIDYFGYDNSGSLDVISAGFWQHLSGVLGQMHVGNGAAVVDTFDNTENLQTALLGAPYRTNSPAVLYASYVINMDSSRMPRNNGTYFTMFNDGSGNTADVEGCVVAATNGAAPGFFRLGIANAVGGTALTAQMLPLDLTPGSNYVVVMSLTLSNGFSTLWVDPLNSNSSSITDTTPPATATNLFNMSQFELRESGANGGSISVSHLKVGTTFDAVFPSLSVQPIGTDVVLDWSDPTLLIQSTTNLLVPFEDVPGVTPPLTNSTIGTNAVFYRFKP